MYNNFFFKLFEINVGHFTADKPAIHNKNNKLQCTTLQHDNTIIQKQYKNTTRQCSTKHTTTGEHDKQNDNTQVKVHNMTTILWPTLLLLVARINHRVASVVRFHQNQ